MSKKGIFLGYLFFAFIVIVFFFFSQNKGVLENKTEPETILEEETINETEELNNLSGENIKTFVIEKGEGLKEISNRLEKQGLINNKFLFKIYAFFNQARDKFWPGEYQLEKGSGLAELLKVLIGQPQAREKQVTIVEGLTNEKIEKILIQEGLIQENEFAPALEEIINDKDLLEKYDFLEEAKNNFYFPYSTKEFELVGLQGYLFPDTYRFYEETTAKDIIKKMLDNFDKKVSVELRQKAKENKRNLFEVLIMASLVEKEASFEQDQRLIADIFWKRLKVGWALESCATINYILGEPKERLSIEDTRTPSPYNTYLNAGLPPTPINNPSLSSIRATIEPLANDYCCFLATPDGKTIFSRTIEEHNQNKEKYLR